ncbi:MAG: cobalamin biosynthesis protein, partial [Pseudomonadota bacterium]
GMGLIAVPEAELRRQVTATQSGASRGSYGTGSVAEAAALAAAGPGARLLAPRSVSDDRLATCALAKSRAEPEGGA